MCAVLMISQTFIYYCKVYASPNTVCLLKLYSYDSLDMNKVERKISLLLHPYSVI